MAELSNLFIYLERFLSILTKLLQIVNYHFSFVSLFHFLIMESIIYFLVLCFLPYVVIMFKSISHILKKKSDLSFKHETFIIYLSFLFKFIKKLSHSPLHIFILQGEGYGSGSVSTGTKMLMVVCTNT